MNWLQKDQLLRIRRLCCRLRRFVSVAEFVGPPFHPALTITAVIFSRRCACEGKNAFIQFANAGVDRFDVPNVLVQRLLGG